jgi:ABC-type sugar transport system ATPase subunit
LNTARSKKACSRCSGGKPLHLAHGFFDVSFELMPHEVLGITGLLGSGPARNWGCRSLVTCLPTRESLSARKELTVKAIKDVTAKGLATSRQTVSVKAFSCPNPSTTNAVVTIIDSLLTSIEVFRQGEGL